MLACVPYRSTLKRFKPNKYMVFTGANATQTAKQIRDDDAHFGVLCVIGPRMVRAVVNSGIQVEAIQSAYFTFLAFPNSTDELRTNLLQGIGLDSR